MRPVPNRTPWPRKLLLAAIATLVALGIGELLARLVPVTPPGASTGTIYAPGGRRVPLGEIIHYMTRVQGGTAETDGGLQGPHGGLQHDLKLRMGYENPAPRWDYFDEHGCIAVDTNSLGFRDLEFAVQKQPGEFRVLALGDSFTYGQGVRLDLTWPQVLEARLRAEHSGPVEVINAGFACGPGVNSPDGYDRWLASDGLQFAPDLVIVGLCLNDMGPVPLLSYPIVPLEPVAGGWSRLLDLTVRWWRQRQVMGQPRDMATIVDQQPAAWEASKAALLRIQALCSKARIPLVVAVFPMLSELGLDPFRRLHEMVATFCRNHGIRSVDLRARFRGQRETDLWVHPTDQHPNHVGHRLQAEGILDYLRAERLLPR
jgi:lysophospholipase L1-like esterase